MGAIWTTLWVAVALLDISMTMASIGSPEAVGHLSLQLSGYGLDFRPLLCRRPARASVVSAGDGRLSWPPPSILSLVILQA